MCYNWLSHSSKLVTTSTNNWSWSLRSEVLYEHEQLQEYSLLINVVSIWGLFVKFSQLSFFVLEQSGKLVSVLFWSAVTGRTQQGVGVKCVNNPEFIVRVNIFVWLMAGHWSYLQTVSQCLHCTSVTIHNNWSQKYRFPDNFSFKTWDPV